jgi:hypothetical protein
MEWLLEEFPPDLENTLLVQIQKTRIGAQILACTTNYCGFLKGLMTTNAGPATRVMKDGQMKGRNDTCKAYCEAPGNRRLRLINIFCVLARTIG